jgi:hypothetical protein
LWEWCGMYSPGSIRETKHSCQGKLDSVSALMAS